MNTLSVKRCSAFILPLLLMATIGCGAAGNNGRAQKPDGKDGPFQIVTTCGMVTDIVKQVVGDKATVTGLMGETVDPHLHDPTRHDVVQLQQADVIFYSGLKLEGRMSDTFAGLKQKGRDVYAVTDAIEKSSLRQPPEFEGHWDPHVWMDVSAWSRCVGFVATTLADYDPTHADYYRQNAERYRQQLSALDEYVKQTIAGIPADQRALVTAHDAFGYFSQAYGIEVYSPQGISTESEAGVDDINQLVDLLVKKRLKAIFVESTINPKTLQAVIEGAAQRGHEVTIGGELFSDAMGASGTYEGTYIGMIDHNATVLSRALGGTAPERGMNGKLTVE